MLKLKAVPHRIVEKPWGREVWMALTEDYCFKAITVFAGCATSLQYHIQKEETNLLVSGRAWYHYENPDGKIVKQEVGPGFFVHIPPGEIHRFEAITEIELHEASTRHVEDVVRIEDSYGREDFLEVNSENDQLEILPVEFMMIQKGG